MNKKKNYLTMKIKDTNNKTNINNTTDNVVKFEIINKTIHEKVLEIVNENRAKEDKKPLENLLPIKAHNTDAKYDVFAMSVKYDEKNDCWVYGTNLRMEPPKGQYLSFVPRSSNRKTDCYMTNHYAVGDYGYRGEYFICFKNRTSSSIRKSVNFIINILQNVISYTGLIKFKNDLSKYYIDDKKPYNIGDRIAQMSREYVNDIVFEESNLNPDETERGEGGHGSTGK